MQYMSVTLEHLEEYPLSVPLQEEMYFFELPCDSPHFKRMGNRTLIRKGECGRLCVKKVIVTDRDMTMRILYSACMKNSPVRGRALVIVEPTSGPRKFFYKINLYESKKDAPVPFEVQRLALDIFPEMRENLDKNQIPYVIT